ncbi:MAG: NfeD family protein [Phycisphaerales bacterium]
MAASLVMVVWTLAGIGQGSAGQAAVPASRQANNVAILTIRGEINSTTLGSIRRRIQIAERAGANALVFEIDTPGGDLRAVLGICDAIKGSSIKNTVAWVNRDAYSGGAVIALACREIVATDPCTLGDAIPILGPSMFGMINTMPESERQKFLSPLISELVESARLHGRDELLVQGIASRGVELWLIENTTTQQRVFVTKAEYARVFGEAPEVGMTPVLPAAPPMPETSTPAGAAEQPKTPTLPDPTRLLQRRSRGGHRPSVPVPPPSPNDPNRFVAGAPGLEAIAGEVTARQQLPLSRPVLTGADRDRWRLVEYVSTGAGPFVFKAEQLKRYGLSVATVQNEEELKAFLGAKHLLRLDQTWSEGLVAILTMRPVQGLLLVIFLLATFVEITHPGAVLPAGVATVALALLLGPQLLVNLANWWEVAAIVGGLALVLIEIFVIPGVGAFGFVGLALMFGGLVAAFLPSGGIFPDTPAQQSGLVYSLATLLLSVVTSGALMYFVARNFGSLPIFGRLVLKESGDVDLRPGDDLLRAIGASAGAVKVGATGVAQTPLRPSGRAQFGDRLVDVVSETGFVEPGQAVRVTNVSDFRVGVERA